MTELPCPRCGAETKVVDIKASYSSDDIGRLRECETHGRFWSRERFFKWVDNAGAQTGPNQAKSRQKTSFSAGSKMGGRGGPSLFPESDQRLRAGEDSKGSEQDPPGGGLDESKLGQIGKGRGRALAYSPAFERLWAGCDDRRGRKLPAFRAFVKFKPDVELVIARYAQWQGTEQWKRGIIPHLSTLLNAAFWETEPGPGEFVKRGGSAPVPLPIRIEDARATRALDARIEGLRMLGMGKKTEPRRQEVSEHVRQLADGKVVS